jgi:dihydrofolate reductase
MRKLKLQVQMSIDGFISGQNGAMDWMAFNWTEDIKSYVEALTLPVDTILLGKNLAMGFIPHWAAVANDDSSPEQQAGIKFSTTRKIVFGKSLPQSVWENTIVENGDFVEKISALKQEQGGDIIAYGGGKFVSSLIQAKLIDEFHLFVNPAVIGMGMPIFQEVTPMQKMTMVHSKQFDCGIIVLVYKLA